MTDVQPKEGGGKMRHAKMISIAATGAVAICLLFAGIAGCSTYQKTTTSKTQAATAVPPGNSGAVQSSPSPATGTQSQTSTETQVATEVKARSHGLIGGLFYFIGDVLAFPFRVIGGVFDAIF